MPHLRILTIRLRSTNRGEMLDVHNTYSAMSAKQRCNLRMTEYLEVVRVLHKRIIETTDPPMEMAHQML